jgi:beta-N-acetylhexosaminidase
VASAIVLVLLGFVIPDPIVFPWRLAFSAGLAVTAVIIAMALLLVRCRWTALLLACCALYPLWQDAGPWIARRKVLAHANIEIGRHFIVGYSDVATARDLVGRAYVGGVFLSRRNVTGRTTADVAAEIAGLQAIRHAAGLPPLIVAADQEGGPVSHLSPPLPKPPALSTLAGLPQDARRQAARQLGMESGSALRAMGLTMDFAPVSDLTPTGRADVMDWNTQIATRAISADPAITADIAAGFSEGLVAEGVTPTAKHFPGLGRVPADTHLFAAALDVPEAELRASDWVPFRAVLAVPGAAVMLSHVALAAVDAGVPASRSRPVVSGILRQQWGFGGVAVTDDLSMGPVEHAGLCRAVAGALNAGIDLLLVSWDTDKVYPALECARDALEAGRLDPAMLEQSARRLDHMGGD